MSELPAFPRRGRAEDAFDFPAQYLPESMFFSASGFESGLYVPWRRTIPERVSHLARDRAKIDRAIDGITSQPGDLSITCAPLPLHGTAWAASASPNSVWRPRTAGPRAVPRAPTSRGRALACGRRARAPHGPVRFTIRAFPSLVARGAERLIPASGRYLVTAICLFWKPSLERPHQASSAGRRARSVYDGESSRRVNGGGMSCELAARRASTFRLFSSGAGPTMARAAGDPAPAQSARPLRLTAAARLRPEAGPEGPRPPDLTDPYAAPRARTGWPAFPLAASPPIGALTRRRPSLGTERFAAVLGAGRRRLHPCRSPVPGNVARTLCAVPSRRTELLRRGRWARVTFFELSPPLARFRHRARSVVF